MYQKLTDVLFLLRSDLLWSRASLTESVVCTKTCLWEKKYHCCKKKQKKNKSLKKYNIDDDQPASFQLDCDELLGIEEIHPFYSRSWAALWKPLVAHSEIWSYFWITGWRKTNYLRFEWGTHRSEYRHNIWDISRCQKKSLNKSRKWPQALLLLKEHGRCSGLIKPGRHFLIERGF